VRRGPAQRSLEREPDDDGPASSNSRITVRARRLRGVQREGIPVGGGLGASWHACRGVRSGQMMNRDPCAKQGRPIAPSLHPHHPCFLILSLGSRTVRYPSLHYRRLHILGLCPARQSQASVGRVGASPASVCCVVLTCAHIYLRRAAAIESTALGQAGPARVASPV
jgi:hypothetical protein